jgi:O6-methylguanine-DNA--protein-cysteine methyltransferase
VLEVPAASRPARYGLIVASPKSWENLTPVPVGQPLARNPVRIVVSCQHVIVTKGSVHGNSEGSRLAAKCWLLRLEGAF